MHRATLAHVAPIGASPRNSTTLSSSGLGFLRQAL